VCAGWGGIGRERRAREVVEVGDWGEWDGEVGERRRPWPRRRSERREWELGRNRESPFKRSRVHYPWGE
jgi:hypothetical protein